ncbi:MAG: hypothetical protein WD648_05800 [Planctomycetaceae bacterium]
MSAADAKWWDGGRGVPPELLWSFTADAPLAAIQLGRETGELLIADASGGLYLLDRRGQVVALTRGFQRLGKIAWSDTGNGGVANIGDRTLCLLSNSLKEEWSADLSDDILGVAVDPFGNHVAAALANGANQVFTRNQQRVCRFDTVRPLSHLRFVPADARILGVAEYGLICCHELTGPEIWQEKTWSNIGDACLAGGENVVHLAAFSHGVQKFRLSDGSTAGLLQVEGTPNRVASSYTGNRLAIATVERQFYWCDRHGELIWAAHLDEDVTAVHCDPLGAGLVCGLASGRVVRLEWGLPERE